MIPQNCLIERTLIKLQMLQKEALYKINYAVK